MAVRRSRGALIAPAQLSFEHAVQVVQNKDPIAVQSQSLSWSKAHNTGRRSTGCLCEPRLGKWKLELVGALFRAYVFRAAVSRAVSTARCARARLALRTGSRAGAAGDGAASRALVRHAVSPQACRRRRSEPAGRRSEPAMTLSAAPPPAPVPSTGTLGTKSWARYGTGYLGGLSAEQAAVRLARARAHVRWLGGAAASGVNSSHGLPRRRLTRSRLRCPRRTSRPSAARTRRTT